MSDKKEFNFINTRLPLMDGLEKTSGTAIYTHDIQLPRMAYGKILRSTKAHALIKRIDITKAEKLPGVYAVMVGSELPIKYGILPSTQDENVLCFEKVRYIGDELAAVAACDEETAEKACNAIEVEYEELPAVLTIEDALRTDIPKIHDWPGYEDNACKRVDLSFGEDVEIGFTEADLIRTDDYYYETNNHAPIETHAAVGIWDPKGNITVWSSTQTPHYLHKALAKVFQHPASQIRVIKPYFGGAFGGRSEPFTLEFAVAWLSKKCGRPVKITYTREELFLAHRGRHAMKMKVKIGVKKDGSITAIEYESMLDGGAYSSYGFVTTYYSGVFLTMPYQVPRFRMKATRFYTNKPACGPKRGHGAVQPRFAIETTLDKIAEQLSLDPAEMRKRNAVKPNSFTVNGLRVTSCGIKECIDKVVKESGWKEKFGRLPAGRGIGLACSTYISGAGKSIHWFKNPEKKDLPHSGVMVKIDRGGGIAVFCGSSDIGQGSNTVLQMITAEVLGVEVNDIKVFEADTDLTPVDLGSYSSRVTFMAGNACIEACNKLKMKLLACARERLLNDSNKTLEILGGIAKVNFSIEDPDIEIAHREAYLKSDPKKSISFQELANWAELKYGTLADVGSYAPPQIGMDYKGSGAGPSPSYSFTAHVVELEGDRETGEVRIDKIWAAHDCGRAINPLLVEGQIEGSVYMGVGEALGEEYSFTRAKGNYNERLGTPPGLLRTPSLLEYKLPTSLDTPKIYAYIIETIDPEGPFGAKEAGEGPQLAAVPAIGNAIYNALKVRMNEVPFTPEKILMELEKGGKTLEKLKSSLQPTKGKKVIEI